MNWKLIIQRRQIFDLIAFTFLFIFCVYICVYVNLRFAFGLFFLVFVSLCERTRLCMCVDSGERCEKVKFLQISVDVCSIHNGIRQDNFQIMIFYEFGSMFLLLHAFFAISNHINFFVTASAEYVCIGDWRCKRMLGMFFGSVWHIC